MKIYSVKLVLSETGRVKALGIFFIIIMNMALLKHREVLVFDLSISKAPEIVSNKLINILLIRNHFSNLPFQFAFQFFNFSLCLFC